MSGRYRLKRAHQQLQKTKQDEVNLIPGELGLKINGETRVEVPDRPGYVYVRLSNRQSEVVKAFNDTVSMVYGLPVLVGIDKHIKTRYFVAGRDTGRYLDWGTATPYLPLHGASHSFDPNYPGADIVWLWERQFMPLLGAPSGSNAAMNIIVEPHTLYLQGSKWTAVGGTGTPDLTSYKPSGTSARMVLVYIDSDGNPALEPGSVLFSTSLTGSSDVYPYVPSLPTGSAAAVGAVRLVSGTSTITWDNLYDLRLFFAESNAAYAAHQHVHDYIIRISTLGATTDYYEATNVGLTTALADALSGDRILIPLADFTGNFSCSTPVVISGESREGTQIFGGITVAGGTTLENFNIRNTVAWGSTGSCVQCGGNLTVVNMSLVAISSSGTAYAITDEVGGITQSRNSYIQHSGDFGYALNPLHADSEMHFRFAYFYADRLISVANENKISMYACQTTTTPVGVADTGDRAAWNHTHGMQALWYMNGALTVSDDPMRIANHTGRILTIDGAYLDTGTPPTGSAAIVDIHKNGTTIFTNQANRPQLAVGSTTGSSTSIDVSTWSVGEYLTMHVDQADGEDLTVALAYH